MKIPPIWVFDIWNEARDGGNGMPALRTLESDCAGLAKLTRQMKSDFPSIRPERLIAVAWALYAFDSESGWSEGGLVNDKLKFAFAAFLRAGGGHIVQAVQIIAADKELSARSPEGKAFTAAAKAVKRHGLDRCDDYRANDLAAIQKAD